MSRTPSTDCALVCCMAGRGVARRLVADHLHAAEQPPPVRAWRKSAPARSWEPAPAASRSGGRGRRLRPCGPPSCPISGRIGGMDDAPVLAEDPDLVECSPGCPTSWMMRQRKSGWFCSMAKRVLLVITSEIWVTWLTASSQQLIPLMPDDQQGEHQHRRRQRDREIKGDLELERLRAHSLPHPSSERDGNLFSDRGNAINTTASKFGRPDSAVRLKE